MLPDWQKLDPLKRNAVKEIAKKHQEALMLFDAFKEE